MRKLTLVALSLLAACSVNNGAEKYQKEVAQIDQMLHALDSLEQGFKEVDQAKIAAFLPEVDSLMEILSAPGVADSLDKNYWVNTLADITYVEEPFEKFLRDGAKIESGITSSRSQLQALRNSIVDEQLDSNKIKEYLFTESMAFGDVQLLHAKRVLAAKDAIGVWDTAANRYLELAAKSNSLAP